ncbi:MAG: SLBB domain-containing protein [Chlorobi bacterium]|nr:SLBB domain-containing protein [Chlorobiota bacterium]MCI0714860.1 SLBB domain-containing protein [Chlorobiota bacterium]
MKFIISLVVVVIVTVDYVYSQDDDDLFLGKTKKETQAAVYDLSDATGVNMEVNLWGFVRYPGRYRVPVNTTFMDLITFAGGPITESNLEEIRILRNSSNPEGKPEMIVLNYDDLLWEKNISSKPKLNPLLKPGDVIVIKEERRYTFRENMSFYLPIATSLISIVTLIVTLTSK